MTYSIRPSPVVRAIIAVAVACPLALVAACGGPARYTPTATSRAPGLDAAMSVESDDEQSTSAIELVVEHLAPPARIRPNATAFVVFARPNPSARWTRVGVLVYEEETRVGRLQATVPLVQFELIVSTETGATASEPSEHIVLRQRVSRQ